MKYDPTISLGTILAGLMICFTIASSMIAAYLGVTKHMTRTEEQILAMLKRIETVEQSQKNQAEKMGELGEAMAAIKEQVKFLYNWATGGGFTG